MRSLSHPEWCVRDEDDIHRSATHTTPSTGTGLTQVTAYLWQLDEPAPLQGVALVFTLGEEIDSHLLDLTQTTTLTAALQDLQTLAGT